jgi:hypothetical protein
LTPDQLAAIEADLAAAKAAAAGAPDDPDLQGTHDQAAVAARAARAEWRAQERAAGRRRGPVGGDARPMGRR